MSLIYMSVDSYNEDRFYNTVLGKVKTKGVGISTKNLNRAIKFINTFIPENIYQVLFLKRFRLQIETLMDYSKLTRTIDTIGPYEYDAYFELDAMGIEKYSNTYSLIASTCDSLDLVLNQLCGADIGRVRSIPNYKLISRALITGDPDLVGFVEINSLLNVDDNLDNYLVSGYAMAKSPQEFIQNLATNIAYKAQVILDEIMQRFRTYYHDKYKDSIVLRGMSSSKLVCGLENDIDYGIEIVDDYYLKIKSMSPFTAISVAQDSFCIFEGGSNDDVIRNI